MLPPLLFASYKCTMLLFNTLKCKAEIWQEDSLTELKITFFSNTPTTSILGP